MILKKSLLAYPNSRQSLRKFIFIKLEKVIDVSIAYRLSWNVELAKNVQIYGHFSPRSFGCYKIMLLTATNDKVTKDRAKKYEKKSCTAANPQTFDQN